MLLGSKEDFHVPKKGIKKKSRKKYIIFFSILFLFLMNEIFYQNQNKTPESQLAKTPKNKKYKRPNRDSKASPARD